MISNSFCCERSRTDSREKDQQVWRAAEALLLAAQSLWQAKNYFGGYPAGGGRGWAVPKPSPPWRILERAWEAAKGIRLKGEGPQGRANGRERVHLARILWHLLKYKQALNPEVFAKEEEKMKRKKLQRLQNMAASFNCRIVPIQ